MLCHTLGQVIVFTYNAETWALKEEHRRKLSVFEMFVLRRICGITRRDRRRSVDIKQGLDINVDRVERLQRRRLTYFGHVTRLSNDGFLNILLHGYGSGQRTRGRPKTKWMDSIEEDCDDMGISIIEAVKLAGHWTAWRNTGLNLGCQCAQTSSSSPGHQVK